MTTALLVTGAVLGVLLSGFVSAAETGCYCLSRLRLRVRTGQRDASAVRLDALMKRPDDFVITMLLGNTIADFVTTACVTTLLLRAAVSHELADVYATAIVTPLLLVFGGIVPKNWFQRECDRLMYPLARPLSWMVRLGRMIGLVGLLAAIPRRLIRWIDPAHAEREDALVPRAQVRRLLHEGAARGGLTSLQRDLIDRVLGSSHVTVASAMIPRQRAVMVPADMPREDFLRVARMAHFSRMPAYEGDPSNAVGVINVFDVITDDQPRPLRDYVRPAVRLPLTERVPTALLRLQDARQQMAVVVDRSGKCVGLITLKDLVEELVGELENW